MNTENLKPTLAVWTVHTPSGPNNACEDHAEQIKNLMRILGAHTNKMPAPEGAECANCRNEANKKPKYETPT